MVQPDKIRLIDLKTRSVSWHEVNDICWDRVWTISHVWDRAGAIRIPLQGVSWESTSFSSQSRFNLMFERTCQIVKSYGACYIWIDAACINQGEEKEKEEQVPFMGTIYSRSAGCVALALSPDNQFAPIVSTHDGGRKAWVCNWFERVWTFQELQLPKELFFVSGDHILAREKVYLSILMMSPYLTSRHSSLPSCPNAPTLSIHDILNTLSPSSKFHTQRSLMQTSKRGCSSDHIQDKVYGILGALAEPFLTLKIDYNISLAQAMMNLMLLMPSKDVLDTLTFNTLPPGNNVHDSLHWSGMVMLDKSTEHPSYKADIYYAKSAQVVVTGDGPLARAYTRVYGAPLWKVVVTRPDAHTEIDHVQVRPWPSVVALSGYAQLPGDFSKVERSVDYASAIRRAEVSLETHWTSFKPLLEQAVRTGTGGEGFSPFLRNPPSKAKWLGGGIPSNRLGDAGLFDKEVTILVCRSKANKLFHYGTVVTRNEDGSWHKVTTVDKNTQLYSQILAVTCAKPD